jgi:hypothetical protein
VLRRRRRTDLLGPQQPWPTRTITLIATREETKRICGEWTDVGWQVMAVDESSPSATGHPTHVVRVAVPPPGWRDDVTVTALEAQ